MNDLIKALQIFAKYENLDYPIYFSNDVLYIRHVNRTDLTTQENYDVILLGFHWDIQTKQFVSFKYGYA